MRSPAPPPCTPFDKHPPPVPCPSAAARPHPPSDRSYEHLGAEGMHSLYRWFEKWQDKHFPDPMGLRAALSAWTLGAYPGVIK